MGKTRPPERSKLARKQKRSRPQTSQSPKELLIQATAALEQSEATTALELASSALKILKNAIKSDEDALACLPALNLLGEIHVELGDISIARKYFSQAADLDPDGDIPESQGGGPDKFLWLAQLSEEGGKDAVRWFGKAAQVLRQQISDLEDEDSEMEDEDEDENENSSLLDAKKRALASALCAITEIYMTDLSFQPEAEAACSKAMEEALKIAPNDPETLQTFASVRISQDRREEAQKILKKSLAQWEDLSPEDPQIPEFAVRISLARLLMEADMEQEAKEVVERLIVEDDMSVEAWYLGGFCRYLIANHAEKSKSNGSTENKTLEYQRGARVWLRRCLKLYQLQEYEDERLRDHAIELLKEINQTLGDDESEDVSEDEWEDEGSVESENDEDDDEDEDMEVE